MSVYLPHIFKTKSLGDVWIRSAVPADGANVLSFMRQAAQESGEFFLSSPQEFNAMTVEEQTQWLEKHMVQSCALALLVENDTGSVIALANCMNGHRQRNSHIATLGISILKKFHRQGLGQKMMEIIAEWSQQTGRIEKLELTVDPSNHAAVALYEKLGYQQEALFTKQIKFGPNDYRNTLQMGLWLS